MDLKKIKSEAINQIEMHRRTAAEGLGDIEYEWAAYDCYSQILTAITTFESRLGDIKGKGA